MSIKSKVLAATAALTLVGGVGAARRAVGRRGHPVVRSRLPSTSSAASSARTPTRTSCRTRCARARTSASRSSCSAPATATRPKTSPSPSRATRPTSSRPAWCPRPWRCTTAARPGIPGRELFNPATQPPTRPSTPGVFPDDPAFETEYAPYGVDSGLCVGVAMTAFQNEKVSLQPCGVSARTVWILDTNDSPATHHARLRAADQRLGHQLLAPVRADLPEERLPDRHPAAAAMVQNLTGFSHGPGTPIGSVQDNQLWGADFGVLR